jgi:hypothetical protein
MSISSMGIIYIQSDVLSSCNNAGGTDAFGRSYAPLGGEGSKEEATPVLAQTVPLASSSYFLVERKRLYAAARGD